MNKCCFYWTPCTTHCVDLMFKDRRKQGIVTMIISKERMVTNYIYNYEWLLEKMHEICQGD